MPKKKKSISRRIDSMKVGDSIKIALKEYRYTSINTALYRKRLEGLLLSSELSPDNSYVTVTRH